MKKDFLPKVITWFRLDEHVRKLKTSQELLEVRVEDLEDTPAPTLDYIPLTGTEIGNPVTGDINSEAGFLVDYGGGLIGGIFNDGGSVTFFVNDGAGGTSINGGSGITTNAIGAGQIGITGTPSALLRGVTSINNYSPYVTTNDFIQKNYADALLPQVADDFVNDAAAAIGGIAVGRLYHTSGVVKLRLV